jgi:cob(I)alamin adenosyltransferase
MRINLRRENSVKNRLKKVEKDLFESSNHYWLPDSTKYKLESNEKRISKLETRIEQLESIIEDAGIIEDIDMSDVKYREKSVQYTGGLFGPTTFTHKVPYVVNEVKVK